MTPKHQEIEAHFRQLLDDAGMELPDRVVYEPRSVGFVWDAPKLIVHVDFDDDGPVDVRAAPAAAAA